MSGDEQSVVLGLVADPAPQIEPPREAEVESARFFSDTPHEILVNTLTALLGRSELRDLVDLQALLEAGGDLVKAMADAPKKDGGFSPLTLAWMLEGFPVKSAGRELGIAAEELERLDAFRVSLKERVLALARP